MNKTIERYGVKAVARPRIKAVKRLDLSGQTGKQIVATETMRVLKAHKMTFDKLADM